MARSRRFTGRRAADDRGLARSVLSEETEDRTLADGKRNVFHGGEMTEAFGQLFTAQSSNCFENSPRVGLQKSIVTFGNVDFVVSIFHSFAAEISLPNFLCVIPSFLRKRV